MNETAYALYDSAEQLGITFVLAPFGHSLKLRRPFDLATLPAAYGKLNNQQRLSFWHDFLRDNSMPCLGDDADV